MSRIRILVLLATVAALAALVSACGGGDSASSEDPQKVIDQATLKGIESGNLDLSLKVKSKGEKSGDIDISFGGPFQGGAKGELPEADFEASVHGEAEGEKVDFEGGLTLLPDRAYVGFDGDEYEVDPTTYGFVKSGFEQQGESAGEPEGCQEAAASLEVADFVNNLKNEGGVEVDGTETTEISGELDVAGAIDQIIKLSENPACSSQLEAAGPLPLGDLEKAKDELASTVKKAHASVFVGEDDDIVRKVAADMTIEPEGSNETVEIDFELALAGVNEKQTISPPSNAKPLQQLFQKIGINPLELLEGGFAGGLSGLLEGLVGGSSSGGDESSGGEFELPDAGQSQAYLECLQKVESASDLQKCANLAPK